MKNEDIKRYQLRLLRKGVTERISPWFITWDCTDDSKCRFYILDKNNDAHSALELTDDEAKSIIEALTDFVNRKSIDPGMHVDNTFEES